MTARLCRFPPDQVIEQISLGKPHGLTALAADWRKLLFPEANDKQFADGYAQAVTFGLLVAPPETLRCRWTPPGRQAIRKINSLIGTALRLLTDQVANQQALKTSLGTRRRVLNEVNWQTISKEKPDAWLYFYEDFLEV